MRFFIHQHKPKPNAAELVEQKALERARIQAQAQVSETLCKDCLDRRCLTGSVCKAFLTFTDAVAWEIIAEKSELN